MEQQQRSLVFTAAVGLIILAIIVGSIYYLVKFVQTRIASNRQSPQASVQNIAQGSLNANPAISGQTSDSNPTSAPGTSANPNRNVKFYNVSDTFRLNYPQNWGILKCTDTGNFELDPLNSEDGSIACDLATKPVTVILNNINGCDGESVKLGATETIKSKKVDSDGYTVYQWCTKTEPVLNITHRVSKNGERATSPDDYSAQVEEIISNLSSDRAS